MKKLFLLAMVVLGFTSCHKEDVIADSSFEMKATSAYNDQCSKPRVVISGDLSTPASWTNDNVYVVSGVVRVKSTLTIEEGTYIVADSTISTAANGVLVITKAGQINAVGTATEPIVFTSWKLLDCDASTTAAPGDFGGVVFLGDAPVNTGSTTNIIEGLDDQSNPSDFYYGGTNSSHDVGSFQYVRIEYAGRDLNGPNSGNEINGLTFGGVGNAGLSLANTKIHHIQVTYGLDDGYEWFGGTVNARYLISFAQDDDAFDFDYGYVGQIDYALALADENGTHSTSSGSADSNGIELDNGPSDSYVNTPFTRPVINHLSIIGVSCSGDVDDYENGIHVRRNGRITLLNSIITGYGQNSITPNTWGINIQSPSSSSNCVFSNVGVYACRTTPFTSPSSITNVTEATGASFGMSQPFFNGGSLDFSGATNGAFVSSVGDWASAASWTKFSGF